MSQATSPKSKPKKTSTKDKLEQLETKLDTVVSTTATLVSGINSLVEFMKSTAQQQQEIQQQVQKQAVVQQKQLENTPAQSEPMPAQVHHALNTCRPSQEQDDPRKFIYCRLKPYNKSTGNVRRRQFINELGIVVKGGTGRIGDVPEWYRADPKLKDALLSYRNHDDKPNSAFLLDVVNYDDYIAINEYEENQRLAAAGLGSARYNQNVQPGVRAALNGVRTPPQQQQPNTTPIPQSPHYMGQPQQQMPLPQSPVQPARQASQMVAPGRAAALDGFDQAPSQDSRTYDGPMDLTEEALTPNPDLDLLVTDAKVMTQHPGHNDVKFSIQAKR